MKYLIYFLAIFILFSLNLGLFNNLQIRGQIPNLAFLLVLCFALEKEGYDFFFVALISGLFLDFFSNSFFGSFSLAFLILALCLHIFSGSMVVFELNWKTLSLVLIFSLVALNLFVWLYGLLAFKLNLTQNYIGFKIFAASLPYSLIYNWLFLYPIYLLFTALRNFVDNLTLRRRGVVR